MYSIIVILIVISIGVYPLLLAGWSSNRKYAILGGLRGVSQTISYEIRLALILLILLIYLNRFSLENIIRNSYSISMIILNPLLVIFWLVSCLAETNRTPFDFSEGESELVSGFNVEYGSGGFAVIFIAEYARIYFLRILSAFIMFGSNSREIKRSFFIVILIFFWIWRRSTLPRFRYDFLINLAWKRILPLVLGLLEVSLFIVYM
jgi:NADH-ubiquinone oxidoreductase chain 1